MLTYKKTFWVFTITLAGLLIFNFFLFIDWAVWLFVAAPFFGLYAWGSAIISSDFYLPVVCKATNDAKKELSITFDDGPHPVVTPKLLDVLDKHQVKAAFFCIGKNIEGNEDIVKQIYKRGHIIANHTYTHKWYLPFLPASLLKKEIIRNERRIKQVIEVKPKLFRPPFGVTSPPYQKVMQGLDYTVIGWSIRSFDTVIKDYDKLLAKVKSRIKGGDVILFHDNDERIVPFIDGFLTCLQKNGVKVVPIDELLQIQAYEA